MEKEIVFPSEWHPQSAVQLTWPHEYTDWEPVLDKVTNTFIAIAQEISKRQKLLIVCHDAHEVRGMLRKANLDNIIFREYETNDTWARDHGGITVFINGKPTVYDFTFNGWGLKYPADYDNMITFWLSVDKTFSKATTVVKKKPFVLEGGSIESDGKGTLLTTSECLSSLNRNDHLGLDKIEDRLKASFGLSRVLWLNNGYLFGDDTDSHIDMLARFCDEHTITYVQCTDKSDEHFQTLKLMEAELKSFRTIEGKPYRLIPLPMADKIIYDEERLPATYANFLIINGAVLMPFYNSKKDIVAQKQLQTAFPDREIIGIDSTILITQGGAIHCSTMQYPEGVIRE
jgi:agmatine/peptidylarginine deiminase